MPLRRSQMLSVKNLHNETIRLDANVLCHNQFIAITDRRLKSGAVQSVAKLSNWLNERKLQQKRDRLRQILSMEEELYRQELIHDSKIKAEEAFKSRENRLMGLKAERERHRQKFVEEMRVQQLLNNCDEIRPYLRQKLQEEYKNCQQLQIEDNHLKKMEQLDQDRLWHEVQTHVFNQMTQRELEEALVAHNRNVKDQQILRKQMSDKIECTKEIEHGEEDTMHCGKIFGHEVSDQEIFIQNKKKQLRFAQDLLLQQAEKKLAKRNLRSNEILHELETIDALQKETRIANEIACKEKKQNMKETLHFLGYAKNVNDEKSLVEREKEILTKNVQNVKDDEYLKNRNYFNRQRDQFYKSIYEERRKQIMDRKQLLVEEKKQKINEIIEANQIFANNASMESELLRKRQNFRLQYGHELRGQYNHEKLEKHKAAISSQKLSEIINKDDAHKIELIKNNVGRMQEMYPVHPNYQAILNHVEV